MTERHSYHRSTFECVDAVPETGTGDRISTVFYHVEPRCDTLPCPPYEEEKEMTCAVCTR